MGVTSVKLNYKNQLLLTVVLILVFNVMNMGFKHWIFTSIGYCLCGLLWVFHPVLAGNAEPSKRNRDVTRLAGVVLILIGVMTRSYLY